MEIPTGHGLDAVELLAARLPAFLRSPEARGLSEFHFDAAGLLRITFYVEDDRVTPAADASAAAIERVLAAWKG